MNTLNIQTERMLSEIEVNQINYIIKRRALRYVAGANKEWLFPEIWLQERKIEERWDKLGKGFLLMPDPRLVTPTSELVIGYSNGISEAFDEYGHTIGDKLYADRQRQNTENNSLYAFRKKFESLFGKEYRGVDGHQKRFK